jgi:hypothetical protein
MHHKIPTSDNLAARGMHLNQICPCATLIRRTLTTFSPNVLLPREFFTTLGHGSTFTMPYLLILKTMRHGSLQVLLRGWRLTKECPLVFFYIAGGIFGKNGTGWSLTQYKGMSCRSHYQQRRRSSCIIKPSVEFPISFKCLCFFDAYAFSGLCMSCLSAGRSILYLGGSRSGAFARCLRFNPGSGRLQG